MMGVQAVSARLYYDFCLNDDVPLDHRLRGIAATSNSMASAPR